MIKKNLRQFGRVIWLLLLVFVILDSASGDQQITSCQTTVETLAGINNLQSILQPETESRIEILASSAFEATNIKEFLDTCPQHDAALNVILRDFKIRKNGELTSLPGCTEPVSSMPIEEYTDELIALQGLRVMFYMDRSKTGHLPWTNTSLYEWMATKVSGIDIRDDSGPVCCINYDGEYYFVVRSGDINNREFDRNWSGISGNIALYAHEARHVDGFHHVSCCGIANGCDQKFDAENLSAYGLQWWLYSLWADGTINVGFGCLAGASNTAQDHIDSCNNQYRNRFCENPPEVLGAPIVAGGSCNVNAFNILTFFNGFEH